MSGASVLVIEDNPDNRELMSYLLTRFGYEARLAQSGADGIEAALSEPPDVVLLDLHMPEMDGYETARRIRQHDRLAGIPIVAVTAVAMVGDREAILARGFDGYIAKPIAPETFVAEMEAFVPATAGRDRAGGR